MLVVKGVDSSSEQLCSQASARKQMCDVPYPQQMDVPYAIKSGYPTFSHIVDE